MRKGQNIGWIETIWIRVSNFFRGHTVLWLLKPPSWKTGSTSSKMYRPQQQHSSKQWAASFIVWAQRIRIISRPLSSSLSSLGMGACNSPLWIRAPGTSSDCMGRPRHCEMWSLPDASTHDRQWKANPRPLILKPVPYPQTYKCSHLSSVVDKTGKIAAFPKSESYTKNIFSCYNANCCQTWPPLLHWPQVAAAFDDYLSTTRKWKWLRFLAKLDRAVN